MNEKKERTMLERVSEETMRFMRGKYVADEVGNGRDDLKFRRGGKTIVTIYIHEDYFDFLLIFGKAEREAFEARRGEFPRNIQEIYDGSKTYHDGKWMTIPVRDLERLEAVKRMIMIKKKPNRKPFPKSQAVLSRCGMRCDLCVHYTGGTISKELKKELQERIDRVYGGGSAGEWPCCPGCGAQAAGQAHPCMNGDSCGPLRCAAGKGLEKCQNCGEFDACIPEVGYPAKIEARSISADDITWAILPYVHGQYGN
ncbi:MAG: DUF3788 domain-containing protein [Oscillospiraceae bacterium]|nr:DUF3788 domain-containing protein [Oscillospiraceae bacterium]